MHSFCVLEHHHEFARVGENKTCMFSRGVSGRVVSMSTCLFVGVTKDLSSCECMDDYQIERGFPVPSLSLENSICVNGLNLKEWCVFETLQSKKRGKQKDNTKLYTGIALF